MRQEIALGRAGRGSAVVEFFRVLDPDSLCALLADDRSTDLVVDFTDRTYQDPGWGGSLDGYARMAYPPVRTRAYEESRVRLRYIRHEAVQVWEASRGKASW